MTKKLKNGHSRDGVLLLRHTRMNGINIPGYINMAFFSAKSLSPVLLSSLPDAPDNNVPR